MALTPRPAADALIDLRAHHRAFLWRIVRTDANVYRFTDHDTPIKFSRTGTAADLETYVPAGALEATATRQEGKLQSNNFETRGAISSSAVTLDDLRKGLWRDAEITEYTVDWRYPYAGALRTARYWISETQWNGETWEAQLENASRWLRQRKGGVFTRPCRWELGEGFSSGIGCSVDVATLTVRAAAVDAVADRHQFTASTVVPASDTRERYRFGRVIWLDGNNEGVISEIKDYRQVASRVIELVLPTPFDIEVGDKFDLEPGCDKIRDTCVAEYSNIEEFGGFPYMEGAAGLLGLINGQGPRLVFPDAT